jgi:hypothetical protein
VLSRGVAPTLALALAACAGSARPSPRPACPAGDVAIQTDEEAAALSGCAEVRGDLVIGPSISLIALTGLDRVARVAGRLDVSQNLQLGGLFLPALRRVGGDVVIDQNGQLVTASLHRLEVVGGDVVVRDNRALVRLDLGQLERAAGRIEVSGHPALDAVVLDSLTAAGAVVLEDNPAWPDDERQAVEQRVTHTTAPSGP